MVEDRTRQPLPPLGFSWLHKRLRTGLEGLARPLNPVICSSSVPLLESVPVREPEPASSAETRGESGLLALCEVATAAPSGASPTSTEMAPSYTPTADALTSSVTQKQSSTPRARQAQTSNVLMGVVSKKKTAAFIGVRRRPWGSYAAEIRNHLTGSREYVLGGVTIENRMEGT